MSNNFKEYITDIIKRCLKICYLEDWKWSVKYDIEMDNKFAQISVQPEYKYFTIFLSKLLLEEFKNKNYKEINFTIIHEISHIYTEELYEIAIKSQTNATRPYLEKIRENSTQKVAYLVEKLFYI